MHLKRLMDLTEGGRHQQIRESSTQSRQKLPEKVEYILKIISDKNLGHEDLNHLLKILRDRNCRAYAKAEKKGFQNLAEQTYDRIEGIYEMLKDLNEMLKDLNAKNEMITDLNAKNEMLQNSLKDAVNMNQTLNADKEMLQKILWSQSQYLLNMLQGNSLGAVPVPVVSEFHQQHTETAVQGLGVGPPVFDPTASTSGTMYARDDPVFDPSASDQMLQEVVVSSIEVKFDQANVVVLVKQTISRENAQFLVSTKYATVKYMQKLLFQRFLAFAGSILLCTLE